MNECRNAHVAMGTGSDYHKGLAWTYERFNHEDVTSEMRVYGQMEGGVGRLLRP